MQISGHMSSPLWMDSSPFPSSWNYTKASSLFTSRCHTPL